MKNKQLILLLCFWLICFFPIINRVFKIAPNYNIEKKKLAKKPSLKSEGVLGFTESYDGWYKKNFSGRSILFSGISNLVYKTFNSSILQDKAFVGKDGWMFLGNKGGSVVDETIGLDILSETKLKKITDNLKKRDAWCKKRGIKYYVAIVPNKHSVYKEKLPYKVNVEYNRLDTLVNYINNNSSLKAVNLGSNFPDLKKHELLYYKTNSHWNKIGGYYGYQNLMNFLTDQGHKVNVLIREDYQWDTTYAYKEDLTKMLDLSVREERYIPVIKKQAGTKLITFKVPKKRREYKRRYLNKKGKSKALIFRDSYGGSMEGFLKHSFKELTLIWDYEFLKAEINEQEPDFVIHLIVERNIEMLSLKNK